jgi:hypothetical protein
MSSGTPEGTDMTAIRGSTVNEHFEYFFEKSITTDAGCIEWAGSKDKSGYGRIQKLTVAHKAHRLSYILNVGEIPDGMEICHKCDNPSCVNPQHLFLGTTKDNAADRESKGRGNHLVRRKEYSFTSPSGEIFNVTGITDFAKLHGLSQSKLSQVWSSDRKHHKGWMKHV